MRNPPCCDRIFRSYSATWSLAPFHALVQQGLQVSEKVDAVVQCNFEHSVAAFCCLFPFLQTPQSVQVCRPPRACRNIDFPPDTVYSDHLAAFFDAESAAPENFAMRQLWAKF